MSDEKARKDLLDELVSLRYSEDSDGNKSLKIRQVEVAEQMGIGQPAVSELEQGRTNPKMETLQKYARAVGARIEFKVVTDDGSDDTTG